MIEHSCVKMMFHGDRFFFIKPKNIQMLQVSLRAVSYVLDVPGEFRHPKEPKHIRRRVPASTAVNSKLEPVINDPNLMYE